MTYIGIPAYLQPAKGKKPRKAAAGQKEMLLPISDKRTAKEDKEPPLAWGKDRKQSRSLAHASPYFPRRSGNYFRPDRSRINIGCGC
jgi:hypothetical protein